jgi:hypothetical protein
MGHSTQVQWLTPVIWSRTTCRVITIARPRSVNKTTRDLHTAEGTDALQTRTENALAKETLNGSSKKDSPIAAKDTDMSTVTHPRATKVTEKAAPKRTSARQAASVHMMITTEHRNAAMTADRTSSTHHPPPLSAHRNRSWDRLSSQDGTRTPKSATMDLKLTPRSWHQDTSAPRWRMTFRSNRVVAGARYVIFPNH